MECVHLGHRRRTYDTNTNTEWERSTAAPPLTSPSLNTSNTHCLVRHCASPIPHNNICGGLQVHQRLLFLYVTKLQGYGSLGVGASGAQARPDSGPAR